MFTKEILLINNKVILLREHLKVKVKCKGALLKVQRDRYGWNLTQVSIAQKRRGVFPFSPGWVSGQLQGYPQEWSILGSETKKTTRTKFS